jgi:hypothetical protein
MGCDGEVGDGTPHLWHGSMGAPERGERGEREVGSDRMQDDGLRKSVRPGGGSAAVQDAMPRAGSALLFSWTVQYR